MHLSAVRSPLPARNYGSPEKVGLLLQESCGLAVMLLVRFAPMEWRKQVQFEKAGAFGDKYDDAQANLHPFHR
jgi:hypothetical protein